MFFSVRLPGCRHIWLGSRLACALAATCCAANAGMLAHVAGKRTRRAQRAARPSLAERTPETPVAAADQQDAPSTVATGAAYVRLQSPHERAATPPSTTHVAVESTPAPETSVRAACAAGPASAHQRKRGASCVAVEADSDAAEQAARRRHTDGGAAARLAQAADASDREIEQHSAVWRGFATHAQQMVTPTVAVQACAGAVSARLGDGAVLAMGGLPQVPPGQAWAALGEAHGAAPGSQDMPSSVSLGEGVAA